MDSSNHDLSALARSQPRPELDPDPDLRVQVRTDWFRLALDWTGTAVDPKSPNPTHRAVRLDADSRQLTVTGADRLHDLSVTFAAKAGPLHVAGTSAVEAARLAGAFDLIQAPTVEITAAGKAITVMAPGCTVVLAALAEADYPDSPRYGPDQVHRGGHRVTEAALAAAARAAAMAEAADSGPAPIRVHIAPGRAWFWATAAHGATIQTVQCPPDSDADPLDAVIPGDAVTALAKSFATVPGVWSAALMSAGGATWLELARNEITSRIRVLTCTVEGHEAIDVYFAGAVRASARQTRKALVALTRAKRPAWIGLEQLANGLGAGREVERRVLRRALASLPEGRIDLALTGHHRLLLTTEDAQTVIATRPAP
jgi:hypothetical protein